MAVSGLTYIPNAIASDVATRIFARLMESPAWFAVGSGARARQVIHYGYKYDYSRATRPIAIDPIPDELATLAPGFDQLIINKYDSGQGIAPHIDHPIQFGDTIFCITLGAGIQIDFAHPSGTTHALWVAPGSAYKLTGEARYVWTHAIAPRKSDHVAGEHITRGTRISLTYRKVGTS